MEIFITNAKREARSGPQAQERAGPTHEVPRTVLNDLFNSNLPPHELSITRLQNETMGLLAAGIQTTKTALAVASFHILNEPFICRKLRAELNDAIPNPSDIPALTQLETLPYLSACVEEGNLPARVEGTQKG